MKIADTYKKSLNEKWLIRFKTNHPDGDYYDGIVLKETESFIVLAPELDFEFDGIYILAKKYIKGYRDGKFEECCNKIIRFNGQIKKIKLPVWLNQCNKIEDVFRGIKRHNIWPLVEILFNKNKESDFYIGSIVGGNDKEFGIRSYDSTGEWEKEYVLNYDEVLRIGFNDRYSKNFNRFVKNNERETEHL